MAAFRIHEDKYNSFASKNMEVIYSNNNQTMQSKRIVLKEIEMKRIPLRANNNHIIKPNNVLEKNKSQVQIKSQIQLPVRKEIVTVKNDKENKVNYTHKQQVITNNIPDFKIFINKENVDLPSWETLDFFNLTKDHIYLSTSEYQDSIYKYLLHLERNMKRPKHDYMEKQPELNHKMRAILIDWLSSVAEEYNLHPQTFHLAIHYLDTFLSRMSVVKNKLQLVGSAAMLIASKYEEIYPPETREFVYLTADSYTIKQLKRMEQLILKVLQFDLSQPTTFSFILHLTAVLNLHKKTMLLAMYFSELILLEGNDYHRFYPSQLAFAAIALARHTLNEQVVWPEDIAALTGYSLKTLSPLIKRQHQSFQDSPTRAQQSIQDKYKSTKYGRVSLMKPRVLDLEE